MKIYQRIRILQNILSEENDNKPSKEDSEKYECLKKWLDENGAIYKRNFSFPHLFGIFNVPGCKAVRDIPENTVMVFIPRPLMIVSRTYEDLLPKDIAQDDENKSTLILTLFLLTEREKKDSFFAPYLNLLFDQDHFVFWDEKDVSELDNEKMKLSYKLSCYEVNEYYLDTIKDKRYKHLKKLDFIMNYYHVLSRQFFIDDTASALIPGADLLNHSTVNIRYEIYDSENFVFKYTDLLCDNDEEDLHPTLSDEKPVNSPSYNRYLPIQDNGEDDGKRIKMVLGKNDYFVLATSLEERFKKGFQLYSSYSKLGNKSLIKYYGFCLIENFDDYTIQTYVLERGKDLMFEKYMEVAFKSSYKTVSDPVHNLLKIKVKFSSVCNLLIRYYRFMHYYSIGKAIEFLSYTFDLKIELDAIGECISVLEKSLKDLSNLHTIEFDLSHLENLLFTKSDKLSHREVYACIFRLTQKINLAHQLDLLKTLQAMLTKYQCKSYKEIAEHIEELENISEYDDDKNCKEKLKEYSIRYI